MMIGYAQLGGAIVDPRVRCREIGCAPSHVRNAA
jgi:hypothetical protein